MSPQVSAKTTSKWDAWIIAVTAVGSLICLNILAGDYFLRADLTRENVYTLSAATEKVVTNLEDPVHVTAYFTRDLPPPFSTTARDVADLLEEYRVLSDGKISFEVKDPESMESDEDRAKKKDVKRNILGQVVRQETDVDKQLAALGVQPVEVRVIENDQQIQKPGYMGVVVRYQDKTKAIPVVRSADVLEYDLTTQIRNLTRPRSPVLGVLQGNGELSLQEDLQRLKTALTESYDVRGVELKGKSAEDADKALEDVDALLVMGTKEAYGAEAIGAIDRFMMKGRGAAFFVDNVNVDLKTFAPSPMDHGFDALLSTYGVTISDDLVADVECASFPISERRSFMVVQRNIKYPFFPVAKNLDQEHPVTKGLKGFALPWSAALVASAPEGCELTTLVKSTEKSWTEAGTPQNLSPRREWDKAAVNLNGPHALVAAVSGTLPSHTDKGKKAAKESRVVVVGTSGPGSRNFLDQQSGAFILNTVDWIMLEHGLLEIRSRGQQDPSIDDDLSPTTALFVEWGNKAGIPLFAVFVAVLNWQRRKSLRKKVASEVSA